jgi:hypothetical protein
VAALTPTNYCFKRSQIRNIRIILRSSTKMRKMIREKKRRSL